MNMRKSRPRRVNMRDIGCPACQEADAPWSGKISCWDNARDKFLSVQFEPGTGKIWCMPADDEIQEDILRDKMPESRRSETSEMKSKIIWCAGCDAGYGTILRDMASCRDPQEPLRKIHERRRAERSARLALQRKSK